MQIRLLGAGVALLLLFVLAPTESLAQDESGPSLSEQFADLSFRYVGPSRGGRVTAVAGHRDHPRTFFMGATGGGVWKTTDGGTNWLNVSDGYFETGSIGSIDIADSNSDIIYVGTGSDGIRSNIIIGRGLYKSTDGGETWEMKGLRDAGQIASVVVHPTNPDVVWAAAIGSPFGDNPERGIYKTIDGGDTWDQILFVSEKTGGVDIELNPADPDVVYAAMWRVERKPWTIISGDDGTEDGVYVSRDGGETWDKKTQGLPQDLIGKIDFAVSPADPSRVYALVETRPENEGLYRSNDEGETWHLVSNYRPLMDRPFYYTNVDVDPTNPDIIYVNCTGFYMSTDGGENWTRRSTPHGDNHDMWINPDDPSIWIQSNDGGANVTFDGGATWSTQHNQPTAELYQVDVDDRDPYWLYAGQQDNTTVAVPSNMLSGSRGNRVGGPESYWEDVGGCETGPAVPKPGDSDVVYSNCKGRFYQHSRRTGQSRNYYVGAANMYGRNPRELVHRFQRTVPIEVSPHDPDVVYHGSQFVHKTINGGAEWETISPDLTAFRPERQVISGGPITRDITGEEHYSTLYVIEESPLVPGVIWTGANDGPVHVTSDGGETWVEVTPPDMPPEGRIQHIDPSPHHPATAYVAGYRYLLNDFRPYVYRTDDLGQTWTLLTDGSNGIPIDTPVRVVREDPVREGLLYAGTEYGLFVSFDDGGAWHRFDQGLPASPITDLRVVRGDIALSTMGRGFWIMDQIDPLRWWQSPDRTAMFAIRHTERDRRSARQAGPAGPQYASSGVRIDYFLHEDIQGDIELSILKDGEIVRSMINQAPSQSRSSDQGMRGPQQEPLAVPGLDTTFGFHRFIWDMRVDGPARNDGDATRGPLAVPGRYIARLSAGDFVGEQAFELLVDDVVEAEGITRSDLQAQYTLTWRILQLRNNVSDLLARVDELIEQSPAVEATADEGRRSRKRRAAEESESPKAILDSVRSEIVTDNSDSYPPPMLLSQISYLQGMVTAADQAPGTDGIERLAELMEWYLALNERVDEAVALLQANSSDSE